MQVGYIIVFPHLTNNSCSLTPSALFLAHYCRKGNRGTYFLSTIKETRLVRIESITQLTPISTTQSRSTPVW